MNKIEQEYRFYKLKQNLFFVGADHQHFGKYSGYERLNCYFGTRVKSPIKKRWSDRRLAKKIDWALAILIKRYFYSVPILLMEAAAAFHMLTHRRSLYHVLYGETDLWLLCYVKKITGNKLIASFHETPTTLYWFGVDDIAKKLDAVILVSEYQRQYFERLVSPEKIYIVPHGINTEFFSPAETLNEEQVCITVGSNLRDFKTLSEAMELVWGKNPNVRLIAVGTRKPDDPSASRFLLDDKRIQFFDGISDEQLLNEYRKARVAIFSLWDGTANNALLEAMACGLPVVITDVGGIKEYVTNNEGILCQPYNPQSLAEGVLKFMDDYSFASQTGKSSRARAQQFEYNIIAEKLCNVYSKIISPET